MKNKTPSTSKSLNENVSLQFADAATGIILNENLEWATKEDQAKYYFESEEQAITFAREILKKKGELECIINKKMERRST